MSVAKIIELSAESPKRFEDAIQSGDRPGLQNHTRHQVGLGEGVTPGGASNPSAGSPSCRFAPMIARHATNLNAVSMDASGQERA